MSEEIGIVMSLYDKVSPTLKAIGNNTKAFDKTMQELEQTCATYEKEQKRLGDGISALKSKLVESNEKVKEATAAWKKHKGELEAKAAVDEAIKDQVKWQQELKNTEAALNSSRKSFVGYCEDIRKNENRVTGDGGPAGSGDAGMMAALGKNLAASGMLTMLGDSIGGAANAIVGSAFGAQGGQVVSSIASGALSGAAAGMIAGPLGAAIGAAVGGLSGAISGATEVFKTKDDAFKSYVQDNAESQLAARDSDVQSGSSIAAQREMDAIAFNRLLDEGTGDKYLKDLRTMAADTPMEYEDLTTMSRSLATGFKDDPERMLTLMEAIGNAGSAVGVDASGMDTMATAMSRMQASGKASLEYINLIQERGVDAVGMLSEGLGKSKADIYDLISKGKIGGVEAVQIIQDKMEEMYGGAMERQSKTFSGRSSTLEDAEKEMQNAYGEGYNDKRAEGIEAQTEWLSGASGEAQAEANKAIGAWQASLENSKEQYIRDAVTGAMETSNYQKARAEGDAAEMGRIIMAAKVKGQSDYNASEGAQEALAAELALADTIRADTATDEAFYDAGVRKGTQFSKGLGDVVMEKVDQFLATPVDELFFGAGKAGFTGGGARGSESRTFGGGGRGGFGGTASSHAIGLDRVPRDNFPALLHEGERVLTAREARQADTAGGRASVVQVTGNTFVGTGEKMADQVAQVIAKKLAMAGVLSAPD